MPSEQNRLKQNYHKVSNKKPSLSSKIKKDMRV